MHTPHTLYTVFSLATITLLCACSPDTSATFTPPNASPTTTVNTYEDTDLDSTDTPTDVRDTTTDTPPDTPVDTSPDAVPDAPDDTDTPRISNLSATLSTPLIALPFATPSTLPSPWRASASLRIDTGPLQDLTIALHTDGPYRLDTAPSLPCDTAPCTTTLTIAYTGPTHTPHRTTSRASLTLSHPDTDPVTLPIRIASLLHDDARLPPTSPVWSTTEHTRNTTLSLPSVPFPDGPAPHLLLSVPDHLDPTLPVHVVVHLHGHNGEIHELARRQHLLHQHAFSARQSVLIVPQGPLRRPSGDFGQLMQPDGLSELLDDVYAFLYREGVARFPSMPDIALTAHSGGYRATATILDSNPLPISSVHLFDALYDLEDAFFTYAQSGGVLRSLYTTHGGTDDNNRALTARLTQAETPVALDFTHASLTDFATSIAHSPASHAACVRYEHTLQRLLSTSTLPHSVGAPPKLLSALYDPSTHTAFVRWEDHAAHAPPLSVRVEGSHDGTTWNTLTETQDTTAYVAPHPWLRLVTLHPDDPAQTSYASDRYGATGTDWLVVDGFDRALDASYTLPSHGFASYLGSNLPTTFSTASHDAIQRGFVSLDDFDHVLWFLGDESTSDITFSPREQEAITDYINQGGKLLVTGSEVGFATPADVLQEMLHTRYVRDDANSLQADRFTFGVTYPEDFPDVLDSEYTLWTYTTGTPAAVGWQHQIITVGFPLETIGPDQLPDALHELSQWLNEP